MKDEKLKWGDVYKKNRKILIGSLFSLLILFGGLLTWNLLQAEIVLKVPHRGSTVFLNSSEQYFTREDNQTLRFKVNRGANSVLVAHEGSWPWTKEVLLDFSEVEELHAFTLPDNRSGELILSTHESYSDLISKRNSKPTQNVISSDESVRVITNGQVITATWIGGEKDKPSAFCFTGTCQEVITIFNSDTPIGSVSFMGGRNDVVVFETEGNIHAIELNREGTQNFQPLYVGQSPKILEVNTDGLYISDSNNILFVSFDI